jgi:hypothetical protein
MTYLPTTVAFRLDFVSSSPSCINIHQDRISRGWCRMSKLRRKTTRLGKVLNGSCWCGCFHLLDRGVCGTEGSICSLVLVKPDSSFEPCFWVQIIWSAGSHGGYRIRDRGVKPPSEFDHYGLRVGIAGIGYQIPKVIEIVVYHLTTLEVRDCKGVKGPGTKSIIKLGNVCKSPAYHNIHADNDHYQICQSLLNPDNMGNHLTYN